MFITVPFLTLAGVGAGPSNRLRLRLRNSAHCHIPLPYLNFMRGVNKTHIDETPPPLPKPVNLDIFFITSLNW